MRDLSLCRGEKLFSEIFAAVCPKSTFYIITQMKFPPFKKKHLISTL